MTQRGRNVSLPERIRHLSLWLIWHALPRSPVLPGEIPRKHWEPLAALLRVQVPWLLGIESNGEGDGDGDAQRRVA